MKVSVKSSGFNEFTAEKHNQLVSSVWEVMTLPQAPKT